jgi:hypothetical protein
MRKLVAVEELQFTASGPYVLTLRELTVLFNIPGVFIFYHQEREQENRDKGAVRVVVVGGGGGEGGEGEGTPGSPMNRKRGHSKFNYPNLRIQFVQLEHHPVHSSHLMMFMLDL